jgi:copper homeostasis protein
MRYLNFNSANLLEGGTTPSAGLIKLCRLHLQIPVHVMIRPRGGDFLYSDIEFEVMREDIKLCKELGADGIVLGSLLSDGSVDIARTRILTELAKPMAVTFHRAFDMTNDPYKALEDIISIGGISRILTSGQDSGVLEGLPLLVELVKLTGDRIQILPGGGVTPRNMHRIIEALKVPEIHMALPASTDSRMVFRNPHVFMGVALTSAEYSVTVTDGASVKNVTSLI